jgi:two-component system cell cycle sensor histidine kinase/response regulator CckA
MFLPRHYIVDRPQPQAAGPQRETVLLEAHSRTDLAGQGTILLVEDEEGLRSLNARGLRSRGYSVIEATNGIEAIRILEQRDGAVDLVVCEVVMPEMDGPTFLKIVRTRYPDLKIIFVSGYAEDAFEKSLPENQQFAFLPKPFTLSQLVAAVRETMTPR